MVELLVFLDLDACPLGLPGDFKYCSSFASCTIALSLLRGAVGDCANIDSATSCAFRSSRLSPSDAITCSMLGLIAGGGG